MFAPKVCPKRPKIVFNLHNFTFLFKVTWELSCCYWLDVISCFHRYENTENWKNVFCISVHEASCINNGYDWWFHLWLYCIMKWIYVLLTNRMILWILNLDLKNKVNVWNWIFSWLQNDLNFVDIPMKNKAKLSELNSIPQIR